MNKIQILNRDSCKIIPKGWGEEIIIHSDNDYCCKILKFNKRGKSSFHMHCSKAESFLIHKGSFKFNYIDPETADHFTTFLGIGDYVNIPNGCCHQLECLSEDGGEVIEASSFDDPEDSYRISKGLSQLNK